VNGREPLLPLTHVKTATALRDPLTQGNNFARSTSMMDIIMLAIGFVFFAVSIAYVYACERL
jgi:hypothetical protein